MSAVPQGLLTADSGENVPVQSGRCGCLDCDKWRPQEDLSQRGGSLMHRETNRRKWVTIHPVVFGRTQWAWAVTDGGWWVIRRWLEGNPTVVGGKPKANGGQPMAVERLFQMLP